MLVLARRAHTNVPVLGNAYSAHVSYVSQNSTEPIQCGMDIVFRINSIDELQFFEKLSLTQKDKQLGSLG